jgi:hypothetical protein
MSLRLLHRRRSIEGTTETPTVRTNGLALSYALENSTGNVIDNSGNNINGTISGTVTRGQTGLVNNCFDFGGGTIQAPDNPLLRVNNGSGLNNIAFNLWVKPTKTSTQYFFIKSSDYTSASEIEYQFLWNGTYMNFSCYNTDGSAALVYRRNVREFNVNEKVMFSGKIDFVNKVVKLFKNGNELPGTHNIIDSGTITPPANNTPLVIAGGGQGGNEFNGLMDEIRFWNGDIPDDSYWLNEYNNGNGITL